MLAEILLDWLARAQRAGIPWLEDDCSPLGLDFDLEHVLVGVKAKLGVAVDWSGSEAGFGHLGLVESDSDWLA